MKQTLLLLTFLCSSAIGFSQTFIDGYFTYSILEPGEVSVVDYDMAGGTDISIPSTVSYAGEPYDVTYIGYQAFMSNDLTSVIIPEGVTTIVNGAFLWNSLTSVTIPNSVTHIYPAAFASNELTEVVFGDGLIFLGENAFNENLLTSIDNLPPGVTTIEKQTFANNNFTDLVIPNGITAIGEGAFSGNPLTSVTSKNMIPPTIFTAAGIVDSFQEDRSDIYLYVPIGTTDAYATEPDAEWTGFKSVIEVTFANVENHDSDVALNIFPNPVNSVFTIQCNEAIQSVSVMNMEGVVIDVILNQNSTMDVSGLANGVYFVQLQTDKGLFTRKFIKN